MLCSVDLKLMQYVLTWARLTRSNGEDCSGCGVAVAANPILRLTYHGNDRRALPAIGSRSKVVRITALGLENRPQDVILVSVEASGVAGRRSTGSVVLEEQT